jgi:hypothetical protein
MSWTSVDTCEDLDRLANENCWEDSETLEFYASPYVAEYFPDDISRSGYRNMNIHVLIDACSSSGSILEMVFIDADWTSLSYLTEPFVSGRVDSLKRVYIEDHKGDTRMRCSRLIYRFLSAEPIHRSGRYYAAAQQRATVEA